MAKSPEIKLRGNSLRCDERGFAQLGSLHEQIQKFADGKVGIDCTSLVWMDAHIAASLHTIARHASLRAVTLSLTNLSDPIRTILQKNGTLKTKAADNYGTTMPMTRFNTGDSVKFSLYAKKHLARKEMPRMTPELRGKFFEGIDELFANYALHSKSPTGVHVTGQFYPASGKLTFTLSDGGRGIDGALAASGKNNVRHEQAIDWAMEPYNTTRQGDVPGGLGSMILRDFVDTNNGSLTVISNRGFWSQHGSKVSMSRLPGTFPGTTVILEISTTDRSLYDFASAPDASDIW
jgi:hypothetical protein